MLPIKNWFKYQSLHWTLITLIIHALCLPQGLADEEPSRTPTEPGVPLSISEMSLMGWDLSGPKQAQAFEDSVLEQLRLNRVKPEEYSKVTITIYHLKTTDDPYYLMKVLPRLFDRGIKVEGKLLTEEEFMRIAQREASTLQKMQEEGEFNKWTDLDDDTLNNEQKRRKLMLVKTLNSPHLIKALIANSKTFFEELRKFAGSFTYFTRDELAFSIASTATLQFLGLSCAIGWMMDWNQLTGMSAFYEITKKNFLTSIPSAAILYTWIYRYQANRVGLNRLKKSVAKARFDNKGEIDADYDTSFSLGTYIAFSLFLETILGGMIKTGFVFSHAAWNTIYGGVTQFPAILSVIAAAAINGVISVASYMQPEIELTKQFKQIPFLKNALENYSEQELEDLEKEIRKDIKNKRYYSLFEKFYLMFKKKGDQRYPGNPREFLEKIREEREFIEGWGLFSFWTVAFPIARWPQIVTNSTNIFTAGLPAALGLYGIVTQSRSKIKRAKEISWLKRSIGTVRDTALHPIQTLKRSTTSQAAHCAPTIVQMSFAPGEENKNNKASSEKKKQKKAEKEKKKRTARQKSASQKRK